MRVKKAVIPAAGLGTRFLPASKAVPKEMLPIVDKPTLQYIIEEVKDAGIEDVLIITGRNKTAIEDHFDLSYELESTLKEKGNHEALKLCEDAYQGINIHFIRQQEPKGLGHAILKAKAFVGDEPFAVLLGDDVVHNPKKGAIKQLIEVAEHHQASVLGVQLVAQAQTRKYGIVAGKQLDDKTMKLHDMVEKPTPDMAPSRYAVLGRYVITPAIFNLLKTTKPGKGNEIQLTDALCALAKQETVLSYEFEGRRYDVGDKVGFVEATIETALRHKETKEQIKAYIKALASHI